jgi:hypothetical protein
MAGDGMLRMLAGAAALCILGMTAVASVPFLSTVRVTFRPDLVAKTLRIASNATELHLGADGAAAPLVVAVPPPVATDVSDAASRLQSKVPAELYPYFDVFLYVSKAAEGSLAQHMYVFHKDTANSLVFEQSFPVSTGRERHEKYFTDTPMGLFELDPNRFERMHYSHAWGGARMPWAMFLNATIHGRQTGVALHSAGGHAYLLGQRASGGCVRLPPEKAAELFHRFENEEYGLVPVFAYDRALRRTNGDGIVLHDVDGRPVLTEGYRVLLYIEDYPGGPALVAVVV